MNPLYAGLGVLALLVALVFGVNRWEANVEQRGYDRAMAFVNAHGVAADQVQRQEEQRRNAAHKEALDVAHKETQQAMHDGAVAAGSVRRLLVTVSAFRNNRPTSNDPLVIRERQTADAFGDVFANCVERYRLMGQEADVARNNGKSCERQYDALKPTIRQQVDSMRKVAP